MIKPKLRDVWAGRTLHRPGFCNVCGRGTVFFAIDPASKSVRNTMHCFFCGSISRKRHVTEVMLGVIGDGGGSLSHNGKLEGLRVYGDHARGSFVAYRTFGHEMFKLLNEIGFETSVDFAKFFDSKRGIFDSYVFCSRKTGSSGDEDIS